ncbi:glycine cleavage system aminomethyltransferase GcvT [Allonocardiopsis opalescens]|uniref:Aminomethyltransferase n=1 Tax=Allonocardiopsis opalescens TaxID=1144618 RepID=A0A2T0PW18_9ACTN|nr:glycine cleavage system aminomethyltransferase GcvT [Allonocardiopsis opalescens]PRX95735.1 aminomethyltransferase [Allonocardiopsis opalescens]
MTPTPSDAPSPRATPLHAVHRRLGAQLVDFAGWSMPLRYGSETAEHRAVREAAGLFDLSHMGEIAVTGAQAAELLDYALVGHLSALKPGKARYTMITAADGGVIDDLIVYRLAEDDYLVVANAANAATVREELAHRAAGFAAEVADRSDEHALLAVQGPRAAAILAGLTATDLDGVGYYAGHRAEVDGRPVLLARTGYTGEDGFELFCAPADAEPLWEALTRAGAGEGLVPAGLSARDTLRLEAGMPLYGNELTREVTPYEAGLGRVVRLDKPGDFVGRDALALRAESGPAARLVGLAGRGRRTPRHGHPVLYEGRRVGEVTSGAPSPSLGRPIAMAYIAADLPVEPGADGLAVDVRGRAEPVDLVPLPFYRRER